MIKLPRIRLPLIRFSRRVVYFMVAAALLFGVGSGAIFAAIPAHDEREATRITYNLKGQLSHQAYGYVLPEKPPPNPIYFTKLVDSITASYRYEFVTEKPVTELTELVEVRAMVGSPGLWEKEVVLVPPTQKEGDFTVSFPLDMGALFQLAKDIAVELGAGVPAPEVTLKALVYTVAQTEKGPLREELVQTAKVKMGSATLELVRPLARQKKGDLQGFKYEQRGTFGYDIAMKSTTLYNDLSLEEMKRRPSSPPLPEKPLPNPIYFAKTIDSITATYSYRFLAEKPVAGVTELVEVKAVVGSPGLWEKEVVLVPPTQKEGDFTVAFPLDMDGLLQLGKDIATELGAGIPAPEVTLKALVRATAQTDRGPIQEEFTQAAKVKMGSSTLEWVRPLSQQKKGDMLGLRYEQRGVFSYAISIKPTTLYGEPSLEEMKRRPPPPPPEKPLPNPTLFTKTIDAITATYSYRFLAEKPVAGVTESVEVKAVVGSPGLWEKEVMLLPLTQKEGDFTVAFPLDMDGLQQLARDIATEIGSGPPAPEVTLKALVRATAQTEKGPIQEEFAQTAKVKMGASTLEWVRPLSQQKKGELQGLKYEQRGTFSYAITVRPSTLYGEVSPEGMKERPSLPPTQKAPEAPLPNPIYFTKTIDSMTASYSYRFLAEKPVAGVTEWVEIRAVVSSPGLWEKEVALLPLTRRSGAFTVSFPLDIDGLLQLAKDIAAEVGAGSAGTEVTLKALVWAVAETEKGPLMDEFTQTAKVKRGTSTLEWVRPLSQQKKGEFLGLRYEQRGAFSHAISVKPTTLYGEASPEGTKQPPSSLPVEKPLSNPVYLSQIVDSVTGSYSYQFRAERPVGGVTELVDVRAVVSSPGLWDKEVMLLPSTQKAEDFTVTFPLDIEGLIQMAKDITKEVGAGTATPEVTLKAVVRTTVQTDRGPLQEEMVQTAKVKMGTATLEWVRPLSERKKGELLGLRYEQRGVFSYAIRFKENSLMGQITVGPEPEPQKPPWWQGISPAAPSRASQVLYPVAEPEPSPWWQSVSVPAPSRASQVLYPAAEPEPSPWWQSVTAAASSRLPQVLYPAAEPEPSPWWKTIAPPAQIIKAQPESLPRLEALKKAASYPVETLDRMELTLAYEMGADKPITDVTHQVEATAELVLQPPAEGPGEPGRSYPIVPRETRTDNKITAVFPLDIGTFYAAMKAAAQENPARVAPSSYDLLVKAVVKSTAKSAYGPIEEVFQQEVTLKLDEKGVQWPEVKPATKSGSIKEKVSVPSRRGWVMRLGFMGGLAVVVGAALYGAWNYRRIRRQHLPDAEAEAQRAKKKHRDILVDVQGLPDNGGGEKVVRFDSLEELVKTADALLKPVLHEVGATRHTYCVIDSTARYVYVSDGEAQSSPGDLGSEASNH